MRPVSLPQGMALPSFTNASISGISKSFESFILINSSSTSVTGHEPARQINFTAKAGDTDLKFLGLFIVKDDKGYSIAFGSLINSYSKDLPIAQKMINLFQLVNMTTVRHP